LRAEFKVPNLPVVPSEVGVGGETVDRNMIDLRAVPAKIATCHCHDAGPKFLLRDRGSIYG
jgi:hypothetical protein